jgi:ABC-type cobalamin/Fe3+-siderophores transport system ATPase subunit
MERLSFAYGRAPILAGLDLSVAAGTITGILGPNGSGKTTLVRLASAALRPRTGRITLFGDDLAGLPTRERARRVAVVPQESHPVFEFTVEEIVRMGRAPHLGLLGLEARDRPRGDGALRGRPVRRAFVPRDLGRRTAARDAGARVGAGGTPPLAR